MKKKVIVAILALTLVVGFGIAKKSPQESADPGGGGYQTNSITTSTTTIPSNID